MSRNKELFYYYSALISLMLIGIIGAWWFDKRAGVLILILSLLSLLLHFFFYRWRYRQIAQLSQALRRISNGDYNLEIRDNAEGELSILKSELYKVTIRLRETADLLQQEKQYLADAISDISHQLKTPLTSMRLMNDLLSDPSLDTETRLNFTSQIYTQLDRLQWLVTSLLKLSKLDTKTAEFHQDQVSVSQLVELASTPFLIALEVKEQTLSIFGEDCYFTGDLHWSIEALTNILKNAIEHTPVGGEIQITYHENPIFTEIVVSDHGEGIDREDLPYIFKRFYRGKNASRDSVGIGLAMAKSIAIEQNGDLSVSSEIGIGSTFHLKFYKVSI